MTMGERWSDEMVDELFHGAPIKHGKFNYLEFVRTLKHGAGEHEHIPGAPDMVPPQKA